MDYRAFNGMIGEERIFKDIYVSGRGFTLIPTSAHSTDLQFFKCCQRPSAVNSWRYLWGAILEGLRKTKDTIQFK